MDGHTLDEVIGRQQKKRHLFGLTSLASGIRLIQQKKLIHNIIFEMMTTIAALLQGGIP